MYHSSYLPRPSPQLVHLLLLFLDLVLSNLLFFLLLFLLLLLPLENTFQLPTPFAFFLESWAFPDEFWSGSIESNPFVTLLLTTQNGKICERNVNFGTKIFLSKRLE